LILAPAVLRWMTSVSAQKVMVIPARRGPAQNCRPATCMLPLGGTTRSNSTGPSRHGRGMAAAIDGSGCEVAGGAGTAAKVADSRSGSSCSSARAAPVLNRSAGTAMPSA